jgi:hypothetical protein
VVLPEDLCQRLAQLAEADSRTVSNMAKVLIQQGVERLEQARGGAGPTSTATSAATPVPTTPTTSLASADQFRQQLEQQGQGRLQRLRGAPRRLRLQRPG